MGVDHSYTITTNIVLAAAPPTRAGFGTVLLMVDKATNTLGGDRVVEYTSTTEAIAANTASEISATTLAFVTALFSQVPTPEKVKLGFRDTAGSETVAAALTAIQAADDDWYCLVLYSRADAEIVAAAAVIETLNKLLVVQSDDASWLNSGLPSGLTALADLERTIVLFHDTDAEPGDIAWAASRLVFDPDNQSAGWEGQIRGVEGLATALTSAQRTALLANNANVGLPFSSATVYVSPGVNCAGRGVYEIVSADWLRARIHEDVAYYKLSKTARGEKVVVDATGQAAILAILNGRLLQGEAAGHFVRGQTRATAYAITTADISARRLRFKVEAQIAADAYLFEFNVYLQPDALQAE